jgi:hypothetical protein
MSLYMTHTAVENARNLAQSALPDAPVVPDEPRRIRRKLEVRARAGAVLRATAQHELKLAERIDPAYPQPS